MNPFMTSLYPYFDPIFKNMILHPHSQTGDRIRHGHILIVNTFVTLNHPSVFTILVILSYLERILLTHCLIVIIIFMTFITLNIQTLTMTLLSLRL